MPNCNGCPSRFTTGNVTSTSATNCTCGHGAHVCVQQPLLVVCGVAPFANHRVHAQSGLGLST